VKKTGLALGIGALLYGGSALAAGASDSLTIHVTRHARVGERLLVTFAGRDSAPSNTVGTHLAAVLEPPLGKGGSRCKQDLALTEQNHPRSKQLLFQKLLDPTHTGSYHYTLRMPRFDVSGSWTVCAWQFNNDGRTTTGTPASHASAHIVVR
jgi:hypothetical protein